jgi:hypothetical protein
VVVRKSLGFRFAYDKVMTLAIYTHDTDGMQDSTTATREATFLDPAVDTPLTKGSGDTAKAPCFSAICRTFISGGTRIRTGDTMIFSHMQEPLGMRKTRVGKRIYVQGVPSGTSWFCPYCCATVDTASGRHTVVVELWWAQQVLQRDGKSRVKILPTPSHAQHPAITLQVPKRD